MFAYNHALDSLFNPDSVAIIGASREKGKVGYSLVDNLSSSGYSGDIYPVNPHADQILNLDCYSDISNLPRNIDLGIIAVPAKFVREAVEKAGKQGFKFLIIVTSGFSEIGKVEEEQELVRIANKYDMRILGPNIFGIYYGPGEMNATFGPKNIYPGNIALVSQSGALGIALIEKTVAEELGLSAIVSIGNKADLGEEEVLTYLKDEDSTETIIMYLEGTETGRELLSVARKVSPQKPIIVIKAGRSKQGATAAASHTGSLAGSDKIYQASFQQAGILRARSGNEAFNWARMLSSQPLPEGENVAIVTNGGGVGVLATDACEEEGLTMIDDPDLLQEIYNNVVPDYGSTKNPVDMTGMAGPQEYYNAVEVSLNHSQIDALVVLYCMAAGHDPAKFARGIEQGINDATKQKPVAVSMLGGEETNQARKTLNTEGVPAYEEPEEAVGALAASYRYRNQKQSISVPTKDDIQADWQSIDKILSQVQQTNRTQLLESEANQILKYLNVRVPEYQLATTETECIQAAQTIGYPVVMKIQSPDILHKTEAGGLELNLNSDQEIKQAYRKITDKVASTRPDALIEGVTISEMIPDGVEVIVGSSTDPSFGPTIMFGLGGIYVEILEDVSFKVAPVSRDEAESMISEINAHPLLFGARGESPKDVDELAEVLYRISHLVARKKEIRELDINPLVTLDEGKGCVALDCSITLEG